MTKINNKKTTDVPTQLYLFRIVELSCNFLTYQRKTLTQNIMKETFCVQHLDTVVPSGLNIKKMY